MTLAQPKVAVPEQREYLRELLWNQIWQGANFASKALLFLLLTPLMTKRWGPDGYGLFALSNSLLVSMALTDGGIRSLTRVRLTEAIRKNDEAEFRLALGEGLFTFVAVLIFATLVTVGLAASGLMQSLLNLRPGDSLVLVVTMIMTGVNMTTMLALEPLAARGRLSETKAPITWGAVMALPICATALWLHASVLVVVMLYSSCMIVPNLVLMAKAGIIAQLPPLKGSHFSPVVIYRTLRSGFWYYLTTISLVAKTHGLTFVVSNLAGPAQAGVFYFMLRLTELMANLGSTASETSLASLASSENASERGRKFNQCWLYVALFCLPCAVIFAFQGNWMLHLYFRDQEFIWSAGAGLAIFGLAGAFSRVAVNGSMGLHLVKLAALSNLAEAVINIVCAIIGYRLAGLSGVLLSGFIGGLLMIWPAQKMAAVCAENFYGAFVKPLWALTLPVALIALTQVPIFFTHSIIVRFVSMACAGVITLYEWRRLHRE